MEPWGPGKEFFFDNSRAEEMALRRALHFVFKIRNRNETIKFYREILGMKVRDITYCVSDFGASFRACLWMTQLALIIARALLHSLPSLPYNTMVIKSNSSSLSFERMCPVY